MCVAGGGGVRRWGRSLGSCCKFQQLIPLLKATRPSALWRQHCQRGRAGGEGVYRLTNGAALLAGVQTCTALKAARHMNPHIVGWRWLWFGTVLAADERIHLQRLMCGNLCTVLPCAVLCCAVQATASPPRLRIVVVV